MNCLPHDDRRKNRSRYWRSAVVSWQSPSASVAMKHRWRGKNHKGRSHRTHGVQRRRRRWGCRRRHAGCNHWDGRVPGVGTAVGGFLGSVIGGLGPAVYAKAIVLLRSAALLRPSPSESLPVIPTVDTSSMYFLKDQGTPIQFSGVWRNTRSSTCPPLRPRRIHPQPPSSRPRSATAGRINAHKRYEFAQGRLNESFADRADAFKVRKLNVDPSMPPANQR